MAGGSGHLFFVLQGRIYHKQIIEKMEEDSRIL